MLPKNKFNLFIIFLGLWMVFLAALTFLYFIFQNLIIFSGMFQKRKIFHNTGLLFNFFFREIKDGVFGEIYFHRKKKRSIFLFFHDFLKIFFFRPRQQVWIAKKIRLEQMEAGRVFINCQRDQLWTLFFIEYRRGPFWAYGCWKSLKMDEEFGYEHMESKLNGLLLIFL